MGDRRQNNQDQSLENLLGGLAIGAAAVGGLLAAWSLFGESSKNESNSSPSGPKVNRFAESKKQSKRIIMAVDATPYKGGGIFRVPDDGIIYYYSLDWTSHLNFQYGPHGEPDRFEMVNTFVGLVLFDHYIRTHYEDGDELICKVDNSFYKAHRYAHRSPEDQRLLNEITRRLDVFNGTFQEAFQSSDNDMANANQLSRNGPVRLTGYDYEDYAKVDVTIREWNPEWSTILEFVPRKYQR